MLSVALYSHVAAVDKSSEKPVDLKEEGTDKPDQNHTYYMS